ncbi:hypothetical protein M1N54_04160, partial [Thermodesulfovibrionales bacterium]|nr:hypothetical protein [Thermodesulfovibrionales bacterium]
NFALISTPWDIENIPRGASRRSRGREIVNGELIGVDPGTWDAVPSPASGVVKGINFEPGSHTLMVDIEAARSLQGNSHRRKGSGRR